MKRALAVVVLGAALLLAGLLGIADDAQVPWSSAFIGALFFAYAACSLVLPVRRSA